MDCREKLFLMVPEDRLFIFLKQLIQTESSNMDAGGQYRRSWYDQYGRIAKSSMAIILIQSGNAKAIEYNSEL